MTKGFILVASVKPLYYGLAVECCRSIKQFFPSSNVTLFTHEQWVDSHIDIFDKIITGIPANVRAKMWAMARTPYDITVYIDVDSQIQSKKVSKIFDQIQDNDFVVVPSTEIYISNPKVEYIDKNRTIKPVLDGSFMLYRKTEDVVSFLQMWYDEYQLQREQPWEHDSFAHPDWKIFDMFTVWRILKSDKIKHPTAYKPIYERARKLKWNYIEKHWNASHLVPKSMLSRSIIIAQIERPHIRKEKDYKALYDRVCAIKRDKNEIN